MDLLKLQYFKTVAELENLTRAAECLYVTQPNLSVSITKLEDELGVSLFDRRRGKVSLTANGRVFLDYVNRVFEDLSDGMEAVRKADSAKAQYIRIAGSTSDFIRDLLGQFYLAHPDVRVDEMICPNARVSRLVLDEEADVGFVYGVPGLDGLDYTKIDSCIRVAAVSSAHPLAARGTVSLGELSGERFICNDSRDDGVLYDEFRRYAGYAPDLWYKCCDSELERRLVESGAGVSIMPLTNYLKLRRSDPKLGISELRLAEPLPDVQLGYIRRQSCILSDNELVFSKQVEDFFRQENRRTREYLQEN